MTEGSEGRLDPGFRMPWQDWRKYAYFTAVMTVGIHFGIQYGHPSLAVVPFTDFGVGVTGTSAVFVSDGMVMMSVVCMVAVFGRSLAFEQPEDGHE